MIVKIITEDSSIELERAVNKYIRNRTDILDIKYCECISPNFRRCYSAMVILEH